jgi:hypothetical protein
MRGRRRTYRTRPERGFIVDVVPRSAYAQRLDAVISGIDAAFSDELGGGGVTVVGVGTCGPEHPPTTHVPPGMDGGDRRGETERHLASFEIAFDGESWRSCSGTWIRWKPGKTSTRSHGAVLLRGRTASMERLITRARSHRPLSYLSIVL